MISNSHALILTAALCLGAPGAAHAERQGHDLFPALKSETPAAYAAIETAANAMPFGQRQTSFTSLGREASPPMFLPLCMCRIRGSRISRHGCALPLSGSKIVALESCRDRGHSSSGDCEESGRVAPRDGGQLEIKEPIAC